ncbi:DUF4139 domain-containing protein [Desulfovibrio sp. OttesenSCG-928-G15]|nr:DUF4139 domain-containing protein [Desulfovibrio sp. OttesenSCG-928-G15]
MACFPYTVSQFLCSGFCVLLLGVFLFPAAANAFTPTPSQPEKVIFYPDEVELFVSEQISPVDLPTGGRGFLIPVPANVRKESFLVSIGDNAQSGLFWLDREERASILSRYSTIPIPGNATLPESEPSPERKAMLEKLIGLELEMSTASGALAAADARLRLWNQSLDIFTNDDSGKKPSPALSFADEAAKLDLSLTKQLPDIYAEREKQQRRVNDVTIRLNRAMKDLRDYDQKFGCEVAAIPFENGSGETQKVQYNYVIPASCNISYRLNALPEQNALLIDQDATVTQRSGFQWTNAEVFISTLRRDRSLQPRNTRPWSIEFVSSVRPGMPAGAAMYAEEAPPAMPMQKAVRSASMTNMAMNDMVMSEDMAMPAAAPARPRQEERSTFRIWSLGKKRIEDKAPVRLSLASDSVPVTYAYMLRPDANPKGFLTAKLALEKPLELSPGMAQFSVDGAAIGKQQFSFNGDKGQIFFGSDPQVTATMRDLKQSGGQQGIFSKDDTLLWQWEITLKNTRSKAVDVILEDPKPDTKDDSIKIKVTSTPKAEEVVNAPQFGGAKIFRWTATLQPGESRIISHKVEVAAPSQKDKELAPGRR